MNRDPRGKQVADTNSERKSVNDFQCEKEVDWNMNELLSSITLWCSCNQDGLVGPQFQIVKQDWHSEKIAMKCPQCGHIVNVERSLISPTQNSSRE
jgi:hypothetical protein